MARVGDNYYDNYAVSGYVQVGIWIKRDGVWSRFSTEEVYIYQDVGNAGGRQTVNWSLQNNYALGQGVTDIGITVEATDDTATVSYLGASWTASQSSGERSATPAGEQGSVVVRP